MTRPAAPDFFLIGAPKAGTSALHAALAQHPELHLSRPRSRSSSSATTRPRPPGAGPVTRTRTGVDLAAGRLRGALRRRAGRPVRGESTPFYLWQPRRPPADRRALPDAKLVAMVRDPSTGPTRTGCTCGPTASSRSPTSWRRSRREHERVAAGWAPFWRYARLGRYGEQLAHLLGLSTPSRSWCCATGSSSTTRGAASTDLPVPRRRAGPRRRDPPRQRAQPSSPGPRPRVLGRVVRAGAGSGRSPPEVWRRRQPPLLAGLHGEGRDAPAPG